MKTRNDLIVATLKLLLAVGAGQDPSAEDFDEIDGLIDGAIEELNRKDVYYSSDTERYDPEFIDPLATILANMAAPAFGTPRSLPSREDAIARIQAMKPSTYVSGSPQQVDYF